MSEQPQIMYVLFFSASSSHLRSDATWKMACRKKNEPYLSHLTAYWHIVFRSKLSKRNFRNFSWQVVVVLKCGRWKQPSSSQNFPRKIVLKKSSQHPKNYSSSYTNVANSRCPEIYCNPSWSALWLFFSSRSHRYKYRYYPPKLSYVSNGLDDPSFLLV